MKKLSKGILIAFIAAVAFLNGYAEEKPQAPPPPQPLPPVILTAEECQEIEAQLLELDGLNKDLRASARKYFNNLPGKLESRLTDAMRKGAPDEKALAAIAKWLDNDKSVRKSLAELLTDPNPKTRRFAAAALRMEIDKTTIQPLLDAFKDETDIDALLSLSETLGSHRLEKQPKFAEAITAALNEYQQTNQPNITQEKRFGMDFILAFSEPGRENSMYYLTNFKTVAAIKAYARYFLIYKQMPRQDVGVNIAEAFIKQDEFTALNPILANPDFKELIFTALAEKRAYSALLGIIQKGPDEVKFTALKTFEDCFDPAKFYPKYGLCDKLFPLLSDASEVEFEENGEKKQVKLSAIAVQFLQKISGQKFDYEGPEKAVEKAKDWWERNKDGILRECINFAIKEGVKYLQSKSEADGKIISKGSFAGYPLGLTAIACYAMLKSDVPVDDPAVEKALGFIIKSGTACENTYQISLAAMALATALQHVGEMEKKSTTVSKKKMLEALELTAKWLIEAQGRQGAWTYGKAGTGEQYDHSCTQFAMLGLYAAAISGIKIPEEIWQKSRNHFVGIQVPDGGWSYSGNAGSSMSMTCAGIASLMIADYRCRLFKEADAKLDKPENKQQIDKGFQCLQAIVGNSFDKSSVNLYALYSIERACMMAGLIKIGDIDWYKKGAEALLSVQKYDGSWDRSYGDIVDTSLAILFLRRAFMPGVSVQSAEIGAPVEQKPVKAPEPPKPDEPIKPPMPVPAPPAQPVPPPAPQPKPEPPQPVEPPKPPEEEPKTPVIKPPF
ncbi:MAG: hypothetical protein HZA48_10660 [Planctomycetes bacterium]|nr:hypothetical protein [Planctomycetota bacterium]